LPVVLRAASQSRLLFFSLRSPPPRSPPLSPYTTLFRSLLDRTERDDSGVVHQVVDRSELRLGERDGRDPVRVARHVVMAVDGGVDRKSTRLNSSHVKISYALFCVKKKENQHTLTQATD